MIKVIIADDEPLLLRSLKMNIENLDSEYVVIGQATNGQMALDMAEQLKPDIIFTDIKMPVVDGLDFAAAMYAKKNPAKIVLVSGYQEFEYAKRAIKLGVQDYLVKPVNPLVLSELLQTMKKDLKKTRHEEQFAYLQELIHRGSLESAKHIFCDQKRFFIAYLCIGTYVSYRNNQFKVSSFGDDKEIWGALEKELEGKEHWILDGKYENEKLVAGVCEAHEDEGIARAVYRIIREKCELSVTMAYAADIYNAEQFREKLLEAGLILKKALIFSQSQCIFITLWEEDTRKQRGLVSVDKVEFWEKLIQSQDYSEMEIFIKNLLNECRRKNFRQEELTEILRTYYFLLEQQVHGHFESNMIDLSVTVSQDYCELEKNILELFKADLGVGQEQQDTDSVHTIETVKNFIDYHYTEKLSIMDIAEKFGFNYSYLCTAFKRYFDETPNDYIIKKRIEKAKILFETEPVLSIKEVSVMAGYENPYYFSRLFKTVTKMTPSQYKKRSEQDEI